MFSKIASVMTIFMMVFSLFGFAPVKVSAHTGAGEHTFSASVSPSSINLGDTANFTFTVTNTSAIAGSPPSWDIESFTIVVPSNFTINASSLSSSAGWDVGFDAPSNEIRVSSGTPSATVIPGDSESVTGTFTSTGIIGGNTTWVSRAFKNNSFTPAGGAEFHGNGSTDIIIKVTYTLTTTSSGNGTAGPSGSYNAGTVVPLTNTPDSGYHFLSWTGDADCTDDGSVTMNSNTACTANFEIDAPQLCLDQNANNVNQPLPCTYTMCQYNDAILASDPLCVPPPVDACPNEQTDPGMQTTGPCNSDDVCPNDIGIQTSTTQCTPDACTNIDGFQATVPEGNYASNGICLPTDTCQITNNQNGWFGTYYNYPATNIGMNLPQNEWGTTYGDPLSDVTAWTANWYDAAFARFAQVDSNLMFGANWFPFNDPAPGIAEELHNGNEHHFGAKWSAKVTVPGTGDYAYEVSSDDDVWIYVDGDLRASNPGVHPAGVIAGNINLTEGTHIVDVYFAERHITGSEMNYKFLNPDLIIKAYSATCQLPPPPVDMCPNIALLQVTIPAGMVVNDAGNCVIPPPPATECSDNVDNGDEEDSFADELDPGCWIDPNDSETYDSTDDNETLVDVCPNDEGFQTNIEQCSIPPVYECSDDINNNDGDELVDENDPACHTDGDADNSESYDPTDDSENTVCSDGISNDEDDLIDSEDPGCHTDGDANNSESYDPNDTDETNIIEVIDMCPNLDGNQTSVPSDMYVNEDGNCADNNSGGSGSSSGSRVNRGGGQVLGAATDICAWNSSYLRRGWRGNKMEDVKTVQNFLNQYMTSGLVVDGLFGPKTEAAVKSFQAKYATDILTPWDISVPTGLFYLSTLTKAKELTCATDVPLPVLIPWSKNPIVQ